jgi:hypothetical protein
MSTVDIPRDWCELMARLEGDSEIGAGLPGYAPDKEDRLAMENAKMRAFIFGTAPSSRRPTLLDLCFDAFINAGKPNMEDGGKTDWVTDTKPKIDNFLREFAAYLSHTDDATR